MIFLSIFLFVPGKTVGCPAGSHSFRNHCYSFVKAALGWHASQAQCRRRGGGSDLVTISEQREQDFVFGKAREICEYSFKNNKEKPSIHEYYHDI